MPTTLSYLDVTEANTLAADLPPLAAWAAASAGDKTTALNQATADVDGAMPYQGRPYDPAQARQFPRVAEDPHVGSAAGPAPDVAGAAGGGVWDWDDGTHAAVVPRDVKAAVLYQADAILAGSREARLAAQHDGVVYELTGSLAESYKRTTGPGATTGLCRPAWVLLRKYRLRS